MGEFYFKYALPQAIDLFLKSYLESICEASIKLRVSMRICFSGEAFQENICSNE